MGMNVLDVRNTERKSIQQAEAAVIAANELIGLTPLGLTYGLPKLSVSEWERSNASGMLRRMLQRKSTPFDADEVAPARFVSVAYPHFTMHIGVDVSPATEPSSLGGVTKGPTSRVQYIFEPRTDSAEFRQDKHLSSMRVTVDQGMLGANISKVVVDFQDGNRMGRYTHRPGKRPDFELEVDGSNSGGRLDSHTLHPSGLMADLYGALLKQRTRVEDKVALLIAAFDVGAANASQVLDQGEALTLREIIGVRRQAGMDIRMTPEFARTLLHDGLYSALSAAAKATRERGINMQVNNIVADLNKEQIQVVVMPGTGDSAENPAVIPNKDAAAFVRHTAENAYNALAGRTTPDVEAEKRSWTSPYFNWEATEESLHIFAETIGLDTLSDLFVKWQPMSLVTKVSLGWSLSGDRNDRRTMLEHYDSIRANGQELIDFVRETRKTRPAKYLLPLDWSQTIRRPGKSGNFEMLPKALFGNDALILPESIRSMGVGSTAQIGPATVTIGAGINREKPATDAVHASVVLEPAQEEIVNAVYYSQNTSEKGHRAAVLTLGHYTGTPMNDIECRIVYGASGRLIEYRKIPDIWIGNSPSEQRLRFPTMLPCLPEEVPEHVRLVMEEIVNQVIGDHEATIDVEYSREPQGSPDTGREIYAAKRDFLRPLEVGKRLMARMIQRSVEIAQG